MVRLGLAALVAALFIAPPAVAELGVLEIEPNGTVQEVLGTAKDGRATVERAAAQLAGDAGQAAGEGPFVNPDASWAPEFDAMLLGVAGLALAGALAIAGGARFVTPAEVLENPVRQRIFAHLRARTGATLKQVTDDLGLTTTNAIWHLRKLEDAGLIHSRRFNGFKVFYPAEGGVNARRLSLSMTALQNGNAQEVFEFVLANPGSHQREIARALNVNHGTVRWHLKKLRSAELLTEERRGKTSTYLATEVGREALANLRQTVVAAPQPAVSS